MKVKPLNKLVQIQPNKEVQKIETVDVGEEKVQVVQTRIESAVVLAVGKDVKKVKKGENVMYKIYSVSPIKLDEEEFYFIEEDLILATFKDEAPKNK